MNARSIMTVAVLLLTAGRVCASDTSDAIGVFVETEKTSFWRTSASPSFSVDLDYPPQADSVAVDVRGAKFHRTWEGVTAPSIAIDLPAASADDENVYTLTLTFNDGTVRTASFAVVASQAVGDETVATFGRTAGTGEVTARSVLPLPYGTTDLTVDGEPVTSGSTGPQGWFVCGKMSRGEHEFVLTDGAGAHEALLEYMAPGSLLFLR